MKFTLNLPDIQGHEEACKAIRKLAHGKLSTFEEIDFADFETEGFDQLYQNGRELHSRLEMLGVELFTEKRYEEAEIAFLNILDNGDYSHATFDRLIRIYTERNQPERLQSLLERKQLAHFFWKNTNDMADRIRGALRLTTAKRKHGEYFANADEIEQKWLELKEAKFPQKLRDDFWRLCNRGRELFCVMAIEFKQAGLVAPKNVPAFQRAVMLVEHEKRWTHAISLCEEAIQWVAGVDWYRKRIEKLSAKAS